MKVSTHEFGIGFIAIFCSAFVISLWLGGWVFLPAGAVFVYCMSRLDR